MCESRGSTRIDAQTNVPLAANGSITGLRRFVDASLGAVVDNRRSLFFPLSFEEVLGDPSSSSLTSKASDSSSTSCSMVALSCFWYSSRSTILLVIFTGTASLVVAGSSSSAAVFFHCTWEMACLMKRAAAALSTSVFPKNELIRDESLRENLLVGGFSAVEILSKYCLIRS